MTSSEIKRNKCAVENAIAQQEIEGLKVSRSTVIDLNRIACGKMTMSEAIRDAYARYSHRPDVQILEP